MSKRLVERIRSEAAAHELKAAEMLKCARRLQLLAERRKKLATGLWRAQHVLLAEKRKADRTKKAKTPHAAALEPFAYKGGL